MFENSIALATLAASDQERARRFWKDVFGLEPVRSDMGGDFYVIGGVGVMVYESQFAGTNKATAFSIMTDDLDRDMAALREKGVVFHEYDLPGIKTENGVNPLCFGQTALLGCDVWEHSYYIDFRNKRPAYLSNFLDKLVNWENVASRL